MEKILKGIGQKGQIKELEFICICCNAFSTEFSSKSYLGNIFDFNVYLLKREEIKVASSGENTLNLK